MHAVGVEKLSLRNLYLAADAGQRIWMSSSLSSITKGGTGAEDQRHKLPKIEVAMAAEEEASTTGNRSGEFVQRVNGFFSTSATNSTSEFALTVVLDHSDEDLPDHEQDLIVLYTALVHAFAAFVAFLRDESPPPDDGHRFLMRPYTVFLPAEPLWRLVERTKATVSADKSDAQKVRRIAQKVLSGVSPEPVLPRPCSEG